MLESTHERRFRRLARDKGCLVLKLQLIAGRGFPDRTVITPSGDIFFIEFKKEGGRTSKHQDWWKEKLESFGLSVYVCFSCDEALEVLEEWL